MNEILTLTSGGTATIIRPAVPAEKYLLYFHGGGFVYGSKNDLPQALSAVFLNAGYTILAVDYLLAPNHSLQEILTQNEQTFAELNAAIIKDQPFSFCGRSAGGYAMLALTQHLLANKQQLPERVINFYGYYDLAFTNDPR